MSGNIYAIIDIETTGARKDRDRITEIAIVLFDGEKILDQFDTLINPERSIPHNITQITGITDEMVADAPKFYEVAKKIVEMTLGAIFVAHNVKFDYNFLRHEFKSLGYNYNRKQLCTVKLARKVFPGLPSYGLSSLIRYFKIPILRRHRALDDTLATVDVFRRIYQADGEVQAVDLVNLGIKDSRLPPNISLDRLHEIPEDCGVYYFYNKFGDVIYIGKSINIKKRVMNHFVGEERKAERIQQLIHDLSYEVTGSELVALLKEQREIKTVKPSMNRKLKRRNYKYGIYKHQNEDGYWVFNYGKTGNGKDILREFTGKRDARSTLAHVVEEYKLCRCLCGLNKMNGSCFDFQLNSCKGAVYQYEDVAEYNERFFEAEVALRNYPTFPNDFFIVDEGRSADELAVVLVENGRYKGYGYVEKSSAHSLENLRNSIKSCQHNKDAVYIIKEYLRKNEDARVILLNEQLQAAAK